ncbi:unnamed protein product, partial [Rotaria magnacalcarata]
MDTLSKMFPMCGLREIERFQKRNYPSQQVFWTAGRGWGLRTLVPIKE